MANNRDDGNWDAAGMLIGGGVLLGMGIGFFVGEVAGGLFTGLGGGLIAAALLLVAAGRG